MNKMVSPYFSAVTRSLESEVFLINSLSTHQGVKGAANEQALINILERFLPKKYSIGTGIIIDRLGNQSKQCDIVIYDGFNYPEIFGQTPIKFFPIDFVYAVIEVKTTLDQKKMLEACENIKSVKSLDVIYESFRITPTEVAYEINNDTILWENVSTTKPQGFVFGFSSKTTKFDTFYKWMKANNDVNLIPNHIFCLDQGFLVNHPNDVKGFPCPLLNDLGNEFYSQEDCDIFKDGAKYWMTVNGVKYPVSEIGEYKIAIDQSKVLLEFISILNKMLSKKTLSPRIDIYEQYIMPSYNYKFNFKDGNLCYNKATK
ncbi:DUF6602 domain-containing protein [Photobacterium leiognathi]|uniref:DUF6602 domain-containing protein n=1 Tax=Photobacterium leiognathi TaxID=553611 RepID=UPI0029820C23|nr:DUF6602 domain-containing protein [Photobacterium leiognathi]